MGGMIQCGECCESPCAASCTGGEASLLGKTIKFTVANCGDPSPPIKPCACDGFLVTPFGLQVNGTYSLTYPLTAGAAACQWRVQKAKTSCSLPFDFEAGFTISGGLIQWFASVTQYGSTGAVIVQRKGFSTPSAFSGFCLPSSVAMTSYTNTGWFCQGGDFSLSYP